MIIKKYTTNHRIVDRDEDICQLVKRLHAAESSQVHVVYSKTGYGKSSFSTKLIQESFFSDWEIVQVVTMPQNVATNVQEGDYLDLVFTAMRKHFSSEEHKELSFENYISKGKNKMIKRESLNTAIDTISSVKLSERPISKLFALLIKRWLKAGIYNPYIIINDQSPIARSVKSDYIHNVFEQARILLIIENIQNIDNTSYKYLLDWINDTKDKKHAFLFEYTISDEVSIDRMKDFCRAFSKTGAETYEEELSKMPLEYIADVIESQVEDRPSDIRFTVEAQNHYNQYSDGNLWELINYARMYEGHKQQSELQTPTLSSLRNLSNEAKYIISILVCHSGIISKSVLEYIWYNCFLSEFNDSLTMIYAELYEACMICALQSISDEQIAISHASIIDVWRTYGSNFIVIDKEVGKRLTMFYRDNYYGDIHIVEKQIAWQMLICLYAEHQPKEIMQLLDDFTVNLMKNISRESTWRYLELLIKNTQHNISKLQDVYFKILQICRNASLFEEGYLCIELMERYIDIEQNSALFLHKLSYLSILDKHNVVIELYEKALHTFEIYSSVWIKMKLAVLNSYIALGDKATCLKIDKELKRTPAFKLQPEYAIYLRLTNIYAKPSKAVHDAKKSIKLFRASGNRRQEGKSLITYSKLLSSLGKHKKAIRMIIQAKELLSEYNEGMSCIYNNLAGYLLLLGKHGQDVWAYLDIAELYSVSTYDKLSVILNKLAWCYENNSYIRLDLLENRALDLIELEPTLLIHCTIFYNLYVVMEKAGIKHKADEYYRCAVALKNHCSFVKARIDGVTRKTRYLKPRLKKPYHICYLSYWMFDL